MRWLLVAAVALVAACGSAGRPRNLDQAMARLDRMLSAEDRAALRDGTRRPGELHHGFGTGLRNGWGLWHRSPLARWFHRRGIFHADDMSSIILTSYARRLRGEEIRLREQIQEYEQYWREVEDETRADHAEGPVRGERVRAALSGWRYEDAEVQRVVLTHDRDGPRIAKLERFGSGFLVFLYWYGHERTDVMWHGGVMRMDGADGPLVPVVRAGCEPIQDAVTRAGATTWLCGEAGRWTLQTAAGSEAVALPAAFLRLGTDGAGVFLYDDVSLYLRDGGGWRTIEMIERPPRMDAWSAYGFPRGGVAARRLGEWFVFDGGREIRLSAVDPPAATIDQFEDSWGRRHFGRWSLDVDDIAPAAAGGLWITLHHNSSFGALVRVEASGAYEVPIFLGSVAPRPTYDEGLLDHPALPAEALARLIPAAAVFEDGTGLYLAGIQGISRVRDGVVAPLVRFAGQELSEFAATPHALGRFGDGSFIVGFRGIHALERQRDGVYALRPIEVEDGAAAAPPGMTPEAVRASVCAALGC